LFKQTPPSRRPRMLLHSNGITYIWRRNPYIVMWWSAAFPGFGHVLLNQYAWGLLLTLSEVIINTLGRVNEAMVYTFCGQFELAKTTLQPRWMYGYLIIYFFSIWNSYRVAFSLNRLSHLAELENTRMVSTRIAPFVIQFLERKNPVMGALWSFGFPGLGQLYNHRIFLGIYAVLWWWIKATFSHTYDSLFLLLSGHLEESIAVLDPQWLLFMPSLLGGAIYGAYINSIDHNHLFMTEQKQFFAERYRGANIRIFPEKGNERC
jgi:TM2 domain-containing membrane protein YozV